MFYHEVEVINLLTYFREARIFFGRRRILLRLRRWMRKRLSITSVSKAGGVYSTATRTGTEYAAHVDVC